MRNVRWSSDAANDFAELVEYIHTRTPSVALRIAESIHQQILGLRKFPLSGRAGRKADTRELVAAPLPFVIVYRVSPDFIEIIRILHGAQKWP